MNSSLKLRIIGIVMLGATLALAAVGVSVYQYQVQVTNTERMELASAISSELDVLFAKVLQASSLNRSYVISGKPEYLENYNQAVAAIPGSLLKIKKLTADNPDQDLQIPKLELALKAKLEHQERNLQIYRSGSYSGIRELLINDNGTERLEVLRTEVSFVRAAEYRVATRYLNEFRDGLLLQLAILLSFILCGGIWMSMLSFTAIREILMPISGMIAHVNRIAANNVVEDLPVLRKDEIGELAIHINAMTNNLREARAARQAARTALAVEQQNLVDAVEALNDGFAAFDADELLVHSNKKYREMYPEITDIAVPGVSYEALLRRRGEFGPELEAKDRLEEWVAEKLEDFRNPGKPSEFNMSDGRIIRKSEVRTRNGGRVGIYMDITLLKNSEVALRSINAELDQRVTQRTNDLDEANQQLERLNAELSTLIRAAPVAIVALDTTHKVTIWNPAAEQLTGFSNQQARKSFPGLAMPKEAKAFKRLLARANRGENFDNVEITLKRRDGSPFIANISAAALWDGRGNLHGAIFTLVDLTESRALQEQFQQSQKMEVVAELTAGVAHDFNNLLGVVISNLDMLESRVPKDSLASEMVTAALRASLSGVALNRQLLGFSRRQKLAPMNVDIQKTIEGLKPLLYPILGEHIVCRVEIDPNLWSAMVDPTLLDSALLNMAVNSRDAMPDEGTFTISATNKVIKANDKGNVEKITGQCVAITVSDTGGGMPADVAARAFEPFFTTKEFGKGSGLGLSMVYGFVQQSGGTLKIESTPDKGTSIHIYLPRARIKTAPKRQNANDDVDWSGAAETILVVEDNDALRLAVVRQLQELGYETIEADSARPALKILGTKAPIDLMLTDIVMPGGMDGRALAGEAAKLRNGLPIVFTSGFPATTDASSTTSEPPLDFPVLAKPVRRQELAEHLRKALRVSA